MSEEKKVFNFLLAMNFPLFVEKVFETLHPGELFEENWHLDVFAWYIQQIVEGGMKRLVVNAPPRSLKSLTFNIALSAYLLALNPKSRIISISCTKDLARKHSIDTRKVVESDWFREAFPKVKLSKSTEDYFETTAGGFRRATSPDSGVTGKSASHIIVDDLIDAKDANSVSLHIERTEWVMKSVLSRFDNPNKGVFVNISQRLHIEDLSGALIKMPGFKLLKISAIAQQDEIYPESHGQEWSRGHGNILQESLMNEATLSALRTAMGNPAFSAQYLQEPIPEGGGAFSFNRFTRLAKQPRGVVFLSIDTGQTKGGGDYTVIMTIGYQNERYHILDIYRDQVDFEGLRIAVLQKIQTEKPVGVIIETTGGYGEALRQTLHNCHGIQNLFRFNANMSKQERFHVIWPMIQAGDVTIPESATWLLDFRKELISFPAGKHDDQLDALSQYLISADFHIRKVGFDPPRKYCKHIWNVTSHGFG